MTSIVSQGLFWLLTLVAVAGALAVLLTREVMRMALGLGAFMLAMAGFFAYYGFGFLALAELFIYVGGVLVLILFAIMLVHRGERGLPTLENRLDPLVLTASAVVAIMLFILLKPVAGVLGNAQAAGAPSALAGVLLGPMLPQFEALGALLLAALVAVVLVMAGDRS
jgi:NADH:ubiquinone oxidoreductase subunit 6 (subunit J)